MEAIAHDSDHVVERVEYSIANVVGASVLPDLLYGIALGAVWWQRKHGHRRRHDKVVGDVPAGPVHEDDAMFVGKLGCGVRKKEGHQRGIDPRQNEGGHGAVQGTHGGERVDILANDLLADHRSQRQGSPATPAVVDPAKASLVLEKQTESGTGRKPCRDQPERFREVCLKAACAAGSCFT